MAQLLEAIERRKADLDKSEMPEPIGSIAKRMLEKLPPPMTEAEAEQARRHRADAAARQERSRRESEWASLVHERGQRYSNCTLSSYECRVDAQTQAREALRRYAEKMPESVDSGVGIVLFGPAGTGKDHLLAAMMRAAIMTYGLRVRWENGMDLFGEVRDRIGEDKSEAQFVRSLAHPQILALSDPLPPFGAIKEFQAAMLFRVIDRRYSEGKPTWVTMNARNRQEAEERMGVQMIDRLSHGALVIFCNWPSYRQKSS